MANTTSSTTKKQRGSRGRTHLRSRRRARARPLPGRPVQRRFREALGDLGRARADVTRAGEDVLEAGRSVVEAGQAGVAAAREIAEAASERVGRMANETARLPALVRRAARRRWALLESTGLRAAMSAIKAGTRVLSAANDYMALR